MHSCAIRKCILVCERLGKLATLYTPLKSIQAASQFCFLASCGTIELGISSGLPGGDIFCRVSALMHRWQSSKSYDIRTFYNRLGTSMTALSRPEVLDSFASDQLLADAFYDSTKIIEFTRIETTRSLLKIE